MKFLDLISIAENFGARSTAVWCASRLPNLDAGAHHSRVVAWTVSRRAIFVLASLAMGNWALGAHALTIVSETGGVDVFLNTFGFLNGYQDEITVPELSSYGSVHDPVAIGHAAAFQSVFGVNAVSADTGASTRSSGDAWASTDYAIDVQGRLLSPSPAAKIKFVINGGELRINHDAFDVDSSATFGAVLTISGPSYGQKQWNLSGLLQGSSIEFPKYVPRIFDDFGLGFPAIDVAIVDGDAVVTIPRFEGSIAIPASSFLNTPLKFQYRMSVTASSTRAEPFSTERPRVWARIGDPFSLSAGGPPANGVEFFLDDLPLSDYPFTDIPEPGALLLLLLGIVVCGSRPCCIRTPRQAAGCRLQQYRKVPGGEWQPFTARSALLLAALTSAASAADNTSTWSSSTSDDWTNTVRWTPNTFFPNSGNGGFATHDAVIDAVGDNYTVFLSNNVTVEDLTLNSPNATLYQTAGSLTATDGIDLMAGNYLLAGGNISNTIIHPLGGTLSFAINNNNRLTNNTILNGDLNLAQDGSRVRLQSGATFTGNANFTGSGNLILAIEETITLDNKTINMNSVASFLSIEGDNTLTLGPNLLLRGRGFLGGEFFGPSNSQLLNEGTIRADLAGQTLRIGNTNSPTTLDSFTNQNLVQATGGGIVVVDGTVVGTIGNIAGSTLTGGTWRAADNGSRVDLNTTQIQTSAAEIILDGPGSLLRSAQLNYAYADLESTLATNAAGGTLRILGGRNYAATAAGAFVNSGRLELGGGTFSAPMLTNTVTGEIFGHGTIQNTVLNSGLVRAAGGTLVVAGAGIDGQSGTIQVDFGAMLDLSGASADSDTDVLAHGGSALQLGGNDVLVAVDYTNANFGVGNSFNRRANVSGAGQINATPAATQTLSGNVVGGTTAMATMDFGNIHVGDAPTLHYQINHAGSTGPSLRGAIQTSAGGASLTDSRLVGTGVAAGNFGPIAAAENSGSAAVTFNAIAAGPLTDQRIRVINNFDNVADQTLQFTGTAYRRANPTPHAPEPIDFGIVHVGDVLQQTLSITNNVPNDGFSERLNASIASATGDATASGSFAALIPGATNNTSLVAGINTTSAGTNSGTATITLASSGAGTSGLLDTTLISQIVNVTAQVNNFALANITKMAGAGTLTMDGPNEFTLDLGWAPFGSQNLSTELGIANTAAPPSDNLAGTFTLAAPGFSLAGYGPFADIAAGATQTGLHVELDASTVGIVSGQILVHPQSTNPRPFNINLTQITIHLLGEIRLVGDYNEDGFVDAADYVVWRDSLGSGASLPNDDTPGVGQDDYTRWRAHFGETAFGTAAKLVSADVPEPVSLAILIMGLLLIIAQRRAIRSVFKSAVSLDQ